MKFIKSHVFQRNFFTYNKSSTNNCSLIFLHGVFGSSNNFRSIAQRISDETNNQSICLDARCHGNNHFKNNKSYDAINYNLMSSDLHEFINKELANKKIILIGHSMGGKTVMNFALNYPNLVKSVVVIDIAPESMNTENNSFLVSIINSLSEIDLRTNDRQYVLNQLKQKISDKNIVQFLMTNLIKKGESGFDFKFNLQLIKNNIDDLISFPGHSSKTYDYPTLFIKGQKSNYINEFSELSIEKYFKQYSLKVIENAGHWVHFDNPNAFIQILTDFIRMNST